MNSFLEDSLNPTINTNHENKEQCKTLHSKLTLNASIEVFMLENDFFMGLNLSRVRMWYKTIPRENRIRRDAL